MVIARILVPADFGVFAVALVVHTIVLNVSEMGVSAALIRDDDDLALRGAPTVVTLAVASACLLGLLMAVTAPLSARLLGSPKAASAIAVMALTLPLAGVSAGAHRVPPTAFPHGPDVRGRHGQHGHQRRPDRAPGPGRLGSHGSGLVLGGGPAAGHPAPAHLPSGPVRPRLASATRSRRLLAFGLPLAGANIIAFSVLNVDYVVVGRVLGATALGLYVLAFNISGWPMNLFGAVVRSVSLPGFAHLQRDGEDMPVRFASALRLVAIVTLPICFLLGAVGRPLVVTVYGQRWGLAATALVGLSVLGASRILLELSGDFLVTLGRTRAVFVAQVPWLIGLTVALMIGVRGHGIAGAGAAQAIVVVGSDAAALHLHPEPVGGAPRIDGAGARATHGVGPGGGRCGLAGQPTDRRPAAGLCDGSGRGRVAVRAPPPQHACAPPDGTPGTAGPGAGSSAEDASDVEADVVGPAPVGLPGMEFAAGKEPL